MRYSKETFARRQPSRRHPAHALIFACLALLLICGISSHAENLISDPMFNSIAPGTATTIEGTYFYGSWRFYSVAGANGTLAAVSPGRDGTGVAVTLSRGAAAGIGDTGFDLDYNRVALQAGHRYRVQVWARSSTSSPFWIACPQFDSPDPTTHNYTAASDARGQYATTPTWAPYTLEFTAQDGYLSADPALTLSVPGSVEVDDFAVQDITTIPGELVPDSQLNAFPSGATTTGEGGWAWGMWRFFNVTGAGGTLTAVSPGRGGTGVALKLARTTNWGTGDTGLDMANCPIAVQASHIYRVKVWARSDETSPTQMFVEEATFDAGGNLIYNPYQIWNTTSTWACYVLEIVPPADGMLNYSVRAFNAGSIVVDDMSVEDVTSIADDLNPDPKFDTFAPGVGASGVAGDIVASVGSWRYYSLSGALGTLSAVSPGRDGTGTAARMTNPAGGPTALDNFNSLITIQANHHYRTVVWARSDSAPTWFYMSSPCYYAGYALAENTQVPYMPTSTWAPYVTEFQAPANDSNLASGLLLYNAGSVVFDDFSVQDLTNAVDGLIPDTKFDAFGPGVSTTDEGTYSFGFWRYYSVGGALGTIASVSPGRDGTGTAVRLSRGGDAIYGDTALDMSNHRVYVQTGHRYRAQVWARSDAGSPMWIACPQYTAQDPTVMTYNDARGRFTTTSTWAPYALEFDAIDGYSYASPTLTVADPGVVVFDDFTLQDISTISGTVTSSLSLLPIAGAQVTVVSGGSTFSATTDSNGLYSVEVLRSTDYVQTVSATGYGTTTIAGNGVAGSTTTNLQLVPNSSQAWSVYDTFTRSDSSDLGNTEDINAIPWTKFGSNTASAISGGQLVMSDINQGIGVPDNVALLGRTLPADFDMSVQMTWNDFLDSLYAHIGYRGSYYVNCPWEGDRIELWCGTTRLASTPVTANWVGATIRVKVTGNRHQVWLNNAPVIDVTDATYMSGGSAFLSCDSWNIVHWDNFNIGSGPTVPLGTLVAAKAHNNGDVVGVGGAVVTGVYNGFFYVEDTNRVSGIKVASSAAVSVNQLVDVTGTIATQDGEKFISSPSVYPETGTFNITPYSVIGKSAATKLVKGLLVKAWGTVKSKSGSSYLYLDDGSALADGSGNDGIRVDLSRVTVSPNVGDNLRVTGVVGVASDGSAVLVIRPRTNQDIQ